MCAAIDGVLARACAHDLAQRYRDPGELVAQVPSRLGARRKSGIHRPVTFDHLRDTCASNLLTGTWGRAWTIAEIATLLGHSTTWVTERYARVLPGKMAEAAAETCHALFPRSHATA